MRSGSEGVKGQQGQDALQQHLQTMGSTLILIPTSLAQLPTQFSSEYLSLRLSPVFEKDTV